MKDRVHKLLRNAGLNESEATMVQRLLMCQEPVPLKQLIIDCCFSEFTGYQTARKLAQRGFVELQKKGSFKFIKALSVEHIARFVGREQRKLKRLEFQLLDMAKSQRSLAGDLQQGVDIRVGKEAFLEVYDSLPERSRGELWGFGSLQSVWQVTGADYFSSYEQEWIKRRTRKGIKAVLLESEASIFDVIQEKAKREMREVKLFRDEEAQGDSWTAVTDKEAFVFEANPFAPAVLAVKERRLVDIFRHYHQLLWKSARVSH